MNFDALCGVPFSSSLFLETILTAKLRLLFKVCRLKLQEFTSNILKLVSPMLIFQSEKLRLVYFRDFLFIVFEAEHNCFPQNNTNYSRRGNVIPLPN